MVSHSQEEKYLWEDVESMNADHLKPAKYMKNDKDLIIEELKVRAQPLPSVWAHMHVGNRISTGRSHLGNHAYHGASQH